jgi:HAD superfamily, subfamily IIIB (Acid phosphatase)
MARGRRFGRGVALFAAGALCASLVAVAVASFGLGTGNIRQTSTSEGTAVVGLRPTGVGLPLVGVEGTVGIGDYGQELGAYHDSGEYGKDLAAVGRRALKYLVKRSRAVRRAATARCRRAKRNGLTGQALTRACRKPKLGVVFDIDETTLSNYRCLESMGFANATPALVLCAAQATSPAIAPTKRIYRYALAHGIGVYFITGRPDAIPGARGQTEMNLRGQGFDRWTELILAPAIDFNTVEYKSEARAGIEKKGVQIIANVGDQESDLAGGHADRAFKYPNPFYFIGE